jgi:hypothetical protein
VRAFVRACYVLAIFIRASTIRFCFRIRREKEDKLKERREGRKNRRSQLVVDAKAEARRRQESLQSETLNREVALENIRTNKKVQ